VAAGRAMWDEVQRALTLLTGTAMLIAAPVDTAGPFASIAVLLTLHWWYRRTGREALRARESGAAMRYLVGAVPLTVLMFTASPLGALMLLLLYPHIWTLLPSRQAMAATTVTMTMVSVIFVWHLGLNETSVIASLAAALGGMILALAIATWIRTVLDRNRTQAATVAELLATRAELAAANRERGALVERERLAGEIHDTLAQGFTSILLLLDAADVELDTDAPQARLRLSQARVTARRNLAEARCLVATMTPPDLAVASLAEALREVVTRFGREAAVATEFEVVGDPRSLPTAAQVVLLRAVQECLANVRKHAEASKVRVCLRLDDERVEVSVHDDGRGFRDAEGGFGLDGMRRRAREAGGRCTVTSEPGEGTAVVVELPC
jgi:signal transduction histidine kinase